MTKRLDQKDVQEENLVHYVNAINMTDGNSQMHNISETEADMLVDLIVVGAADDKVHIEDLEEPLKLNTPMSIQGDLSDVEEDNDGKDDNQLLVACSIAQTELDPLKVTDIVSFKRPRGRPSKSFKLKDEIATGIQLTLNFQRTSRKCKEEAATLISKQLIGSRRATSSPKGE
ncbi:hypothetical protein SUGI_0565360 [Cryptomeria japonica]|nr:hypothetical protein SUGI_0565360 [Cryptomeria japonica]